MPGSVIVGGDAHAHWEAVGCIESRSRRWTWGGFDSGGRWLTCSGRGRSSGGPASVPALGVCWAPSAALRFPSCGESTAKSPPRTVSARTGGVLDRFPLDVVPADRGYHPRRRAASSVALCGLADRGHSGLSTASQSAVRGRGAAKSLTNPDLRGCCWRDVAVGDRCACVVHRGPVGGALTWRGG
jgi:hypothetical protein